MVDSKLPSTWLDATWMRGYEGTTPITMIKYADIDKKIRIIRCPTKPYFYIPRDDKARAMKRVTKWDGTVSREAAYAAKSGKRLSKIHVPTPAHVSSWRGKKKVGLREDLTVLEIPTYESDVRFVNRLMIDHNIMQCRIKHRGYCDIEVDARKGFPEPDKAPFRVISLALVGTDGRELFICEDDEDLIFKKFMAVMQKNYGLITGWNWKSFDSQYLKVRADKLGIKFSFFPTQEIDAMLNYTKLTIWGMMGKSYALDQVAKRHLGIDHQKLDNIVDANHMWQSFKGNRTDLREYNMMDAMIVKLLDKKLMLCEPYLEYAKHVPIFIREAPLMTMLWDHFILHRLKQQSPRYVMSKKERIEVALLGGFTWPTKPGLHRPVMSLDFKSLYPSIMESFELSSETVMLYKAYKQTGLELNDWIKQTYIQ